MKALKNENLIPIDSEYLAELGIKDSYIEISPKLKKYIRELFPITEIISKNNASYTIKSPEREYEIFVSQDDDKSWKKATFCFFDIINQQLQSNEVKLYAYSGGNDLAAIFLTKEQYEFAIRTMPSWGNDLYLADEAWLNTHLQ